VKTLEKEQEKEVKTLSRQILSAFLLPPKNYVCGIKTFGILSVNMIE
jgi:hypothetical protein